MPRDRVCLRIPHAVLVVAIGLAAAACSRSATTDSVNALPNSPSDVARVPTARLSLTGGSADLSARQLSSFPLLEGTFAITTEAGDRLNGTYTGALAVPNPGRPTVTLELLVTGGLGVFQGATGTLKGEGNGTFASLAGDFVLPSLSGLLVTTAYPAGSMFRTTVVGTSALTCSATTARIFMTLRGQGTGATVGGANVVLGSEIGDTNCEH